MASRFLLAVILTTALVAPLPARQGGGGGPQTPLQEFADRLKLDEKTQLPAVQQMFNEAAKEAAPVAQEMIQLRQRLINLELTNKSEEIKSVLDAYLAAATKMTGLEARVFAQVYATLKPYQQSKAPQAFDMMAGFFQAAAARGGRRGGGGQ